MNPMDLLKQSEALDFMYDIYRDVKIDMHRILSSTDSYWILKF